MKWKKNSQTPHIGLHTRHKLPHITGGHTAYILWMRLQRVNRIKLRLWCSHQWLCNFASNNVAVVVIGFLMRFNFSNMKCTYGYLMWYKTKANREFEQLDSRSLHYYVHNTTQLTSMWWAVNTQMLSTRMLYQHFKWNPHALCLHTCATMHTKSIQLKNLSTVTSTHAVVTF